IGCHHVREDLGGHIWPLLRWPPRKNIISSDDPRVLNYKDQHITFSGGNGTSLQRAIIVNGALTESAGLEAEEYWLKRFYPDYRVTHEGLIGPKDPKEKDPH